MRIAICLSGQPRTLEFAAKSIKSFFSENHEYDFFCHAWDYNTYKVKDGTVKWESDEPVNKEELNKQLQVFNPKAVAIGSSKNYIAGKSWGSLFYSMMYANHLKKQYEIQHNFRYDIVVKSRYDVIFEPHQKFHPPHINHPLDLYCRHYDRSKYDYNVPNASDVVFFGSSLGMDVLCDMFRTYKNNFLDKHDDSFYLGPGCLMHKYAIKHNLQFRPTHTISEVIYRKECIPMDPVDDYHTISVNHQTYYK